MEKTIVVTGGTKGIGRAIADKFAEDGYNVITCARNEQDLAEMKKAISTKGVQCKAISADLSDREEQRKFVDFVQSNCDQVDVLVNNTGVFFPGTVHEEEEGMLEKQISTNLYSAYHITRGVIGAMKTRKEGDVFNICSIASITPYPNGGSYSISKYAMYGMTKVLREEMKEHGVRVVAVLPGATKTASWEGVDLPDERFMKAEDVADAVFGCHKLSRNSVVEDIIIRPQLGDL